MQTPGLYDETSASEYESAPNVDTEVLVLQTRGFINLQILGFLLRDYKFTIFATCHTIRRSSSGSAASCSSTLEADRPYLCRPWQRLVTHRVLCSRQEAENHTAGGSREEKRRQVFRVHCSSSSSRTKASRISSFCATDAGVQFI